MVNTLEILGVNTLKLQYVYNVVINAMFHHPRQQIYYYPYHVVKGMGKTDNVIVLKVKYIYVVVTSMKSKNETSN